MTTTDYGPVRFGLDITDTGDDELNAMAAIKAAMERFLGGLTKDDRKARDRVVKWAADKYSIEPMMVWDDPVRGEAE